MTDEQLVVLVAAYALREELVGIVAGKTYRYPEDVPAERVADLIDFLWNLLDEVKSVRARIDGHPPD